MLGFILVVNISGLVVTIDVDWSGLRLLCEVGNHGVAMGVSSVCWEGLIDYPMVAGWIRVITAGILFSSISNQYGFLSGYNVVA